MVDRVVVIHQQDVDPRFDITVLECIIQNNQVHFGVRLPQAPDPFDPALADGHRNLRIFQLDLFGFVTDRPERRADIRKHEPARFAFVSARKHRYVIARCEIFDQVFRDGSLAGTADSEISDAYNRDIELFAPENLQVEKLVPDPDDQSVYPSQRSGPKRTQHTESFQSSKVTKKD